MSILRPIDQHGPFVPFRSPAPCPTDDIAAQPQVSISFNETWIPAVFSALKALCRPETWEGTLADINRSTQDAHNLFATGTGTMQIGTILATMLATLPGDWLACDGASHLRVDYPALYAVIDAAYIIDADHFKVPDLRSRSPLGAGQGAGLTNRPVNSQGGAENHVLQSSEMPIHTHAGTTNHGHTAQTFVDPADASVGSEAGFTFLTTGTRTQFGTEASAGGGFGHNNVHPFTAFKFAVVAK